MKILSLFYCFVIIACLSSCNKAITLSSIIWEDKGSNISVLMAPNNKIIIGPAYIMLTKKDGFIIGNATEGSETFFFAINLSDLSLVKSTDFLDILKNTPFKDSSIINEFVTFGDLRGQWGTYEKLKKLQSR